MYYELYIDVFFLVNFMMDNILLLVLRRILACSATHIRVCSGAAIGALLTCMILLLPVPLAVIKLILFHSLVPVCMLKLGLCIPWGRCFWKAYLLLYISGILVGGIFLLFRPYLRAGSLFFAAAILSYYGAVGVWKFLQYLAARRNVQCEVVLYREEKCCRVQALIDTGNHLRDSVTGKPVSIVEPKIAEELELWKHPEGIRYISYHTVGKKEGVMPMFPVSSICIYTREQQVIRNPLIAVCDEEIGSDAYRMILNPDILNAAGCRKKQ